MLRTLGLQCLLQLVIAECGGILIGKVVFQKGSVGNAQDELAVAILSVDDAIGVVSTTLLEFEPKVSNLNVHIIFPEVLKPAPRRRAVTRA